MTAVLHKLRQLNYNYRFQKQASSPHSKSIRNIPAGKLEIMEDTRKRPLKNASQLPDVKKSKLTSTKDSTSPIKEQLTIKSARGNKLVLPKRRVKTQVPKEEEEPKETISEAIIQEVKRGKLPEKNCM